MKCIQECAEEEYIQENGSVLSSKCLLIINSTPGKNEEEALGKKKKNPKLIQGKTHTLKHPQTS